jgi:hypothetical protein
MLFPTVRREFPDRRGRGAETSSGTERVLESFHHSPNMIVHGGIVVSGG